MKIYVDAFSNQEIISDAFALQFIFQGVGCKVKSKYKVKDAVNIDIGCGNQFGGTADQQKVEDTAQKVNDILDAFDYKESPFNKPQWVQYIKEYMKKVKAHLQKNKPDRVETFMSQASKMVKWILSRFNDLTFYTPPDYDNENIIIISLFQAEDDEAPTFVYFLDGLREVKM